MRRCFIMTLAWLLAGCASAPPALVALPAAPRTEQPAPAAGGPTLLLRRVTLPGYLDGFRVVTERNGESLTVAANEEWAERLPEAAARVLRDALSQRLGPDRVLIEGDGRIPDADLTIEFLALDPGADARLDLDARWSFVATAGERGSRSGRTRLDVPLTGRGADAVAAATANALGLFADVLARAAQAPYASADGITPAPDASASSHAHGATLRADGDRR